MHRPLAIIAASLLSFSGPALASWFELCELSGDVTAVTDTLQTGHYRLDVTIVTAARITERGLSGYTDCTEHIGQPMQIAIKVPRRAGKPTPGDRIDFSRSAVDGFGPGGYVGTSVQVKFRALHKAGQ